MTDPTPLKTIIFDRYHTVTHQIHRELTGVGWYQVCTENDCHFLGLEGY